MLEHFPAMYKKKLFLYLCGAILLLSTAAKFMNVGSNVVGWHSWRQSDTAAIARNFHESGENILYPMIDWGGGGIVETELQLYTYAVSALYSIFGVDEIYGRLLSILLSLLALPGLYLLVQRFHDRETAITATTLYSILPLTLFYSRAFMPETGLLAAIIWGLYFFDRWRAKGQAIDGALSCACVSVAVLLKIPTLYIGIVLFYIAWTHEKRSGLLLRDITIWIYAVAVLAATAAWYGHAHGLYEQSGLTFGIWPGSTDKWGAYRSLLTLDFYNDIVFKSIAERHLTWAGMALFIVGLFLKRRNSRERLADVWLIAVAVYILIVNKGNQVHEYYQLPFIPPAAIVMARALNWMLDGIGRSGGTKRTLRSMAVSLLLVSMLLLSGLRYTSLLSGEQAKDTEEFALEAQTILPESERILVIGSGSPVLLYLLHRKGWIANCGDLRLPAQIPRFVVLHEKETTYRDCPELASIVDNASVLLRTGDFLLLARAQP
jgi:4-amino-4-deoxy-L-arabinose transferase-like glycosyltransferase